ncbi:hypothetical protein V500_03165 [Pseudogymnoascus sp. VKM F-4518 (FW-2643)]|nr:hypothetical protein V500_03165 [Pseudogymnoascus sp. VKM F-4518 (FW-2643)]
MGYGSGTKPQPWKLSDAPTRYLDIMKKNVIGIEIEIKSMGGRFKMSQEKPKGDWDGVINGFRNMGTVAGTQMCGIVDGESRSRDGEFQFPADTTTPIAALGAPQDGGLWCAFASSEGEDSPLCAYVSRTANKIAEHCRQLHGWRNSKGRRRPRGEGSSGSSGSGDGDGDGDCGSKAEDMPLTTGVKYQRFFRQGLHSGYFEFEVARGAVGSAVSAAAAGAPAPAPAPCERRKTGNLILLDFNSYHPFIIQPHVYSLPTDPLLSLHITSKTDESGRACWTQVFGQAWLPNWELNIVAAAPCMIASEDEHPYDALQSINQSIQRLIFYATLGNVLINAATLIASSGISRGVGSPLCQFQAFALQWLLPADGLWSFCMACNIYLALFRGYDVALLKKMEWKYFVFCYLVPFIPALTFLFVKTEARGKVYGSANNWCWISAKWRVLRIACVYGPIWIFIALTFSIYTIAGSRILECRRQLKRVSIPDPWPATSVGPNNQSDAIHLASRNTDLQPARQPPLRSTNSGSFEIHVSSSATRFQDRPLSRLLVNHAQPSSTRHDTRVEKNATVWAYAKRGMLFFVALIVTWVGQPKYLPSEHRS